MGRAEVDHLETGLSRSAPSALQVPERGLCRIGVGRADDPYGVDDQYGADEDAGSGWPGVIDGDAMHERLTGGFVAPVFRVQTPSGEDYAVKMLDDVDSRQRERIMSHVGAGLGIAPECDPLVRSQIATRFVDGAPIRLSDLDNPEVLGALVGMFRRLHGYRPDFTTQHLSVDTLGLAERRLLAAEPILAKDLYVAARQCLDEWRALGMPVEFCLTHGDPWPGNILRDEKDDSLWFIDWGHGGLNDPMIDLAWFAVCSGLSDERVKALLRAYYGDALSEKIRARFASVFRFTGVAVAISYLAAGCRKLSSIGAYDTALTLPRQLELFATAEADDRPYLRSCVAGERLLTTPADFQELFIRMLKSRVG